MSDTVLVALIVGIAGLGPSLVTAWRSTQQTLEDAQLAYIDWVRRERYEAAAQLLEVATLHPIRVHAIRLGVESGEISKAEASRQYRESVEPITVWVSRLSALGPPAMMTAASHLADLAVKDGTAALKLGKAEQAAAGEAHQEARRAFAGWAQGALAMPQRDVGPRGFEPPTS
jgi:hypothetical protein